MTAAAAVALIMWQDKNKEHPVFDKDPPTRFCTDYPIIILRSSLCVGPTRIWSTILSFDMCSRFLSLLILFLLLRLVSLCFMKNCCAWNSPQKWATLKDALIQATCPALLGLCLCLCLLYIEISLLPSKVCNKFMQFAAASAQARARGG